MLEEREGEGEKRAAASEKDRKTERGKEGTHSSVLPVPFVSATRYNTDGCT